MTELLLVFLVSFVGVLLIVTPIFFIITIFRIGITALPDIEYEDTDD